MKKSFIECQNELIEARNNLLKEIDESLKITKLINNIISFFNKRICNHKTMTLNRWHWVHHPEHEPSSIEAEYECRECGKLDYIHLYSKEAEDWAMAMGDYKKV